MTPVKTFKELGVKTTTKNFVGNKIDIYELFGKEIIVHAFEIGKSKYEKGNGKCLKLQIEFENKMRIVFSGSGNLMNVVEQLPKDAFPFSTKIIKEEKSHLFT